MWSKAAVISPVLLCLLSVPPLLMRFSVLLLDGERTSGSDTVVVGGSPPLALLPLRRVFPFWLVATESFLGSLMDMVAEERVRPEGAMLLDLGLLMVAYPAPPRLLPPDAAVDDDEGARELRLSLPNVELDPGRTFFSTSPLLTRLMDLRLEAGPSEGLRASETLTLESSFLSCWCFAWLC